MRGAKISGATMGRGKAKCMTNRTQSRCEFLKEEIRDSLPTTTTTELTREPQDTETLVGSSL